MFKKSGVKGIAELIKIANISFFNDILAVSKLVVGKIYENENRNTFFFTLR